jgi:hypothetical protein
MMLVRERTVPRLGEQEVENQKASLQGLRLQKRRGAGFCHDVNYP